MVEVLEVDPNSTFFKEIEKLRYVDTSGLSRELRRAKRLRAISLIDDLSIDFGGVENVPDSNEDLKEARLLLGALDNQIMPTDVDSLRVRIAKASRNHRIPQNYIYQLLGYYLDINAQTVKDKAYNNRFTKMECDVLWGQWNIIERVRNLEVLVRMYKIERRNRLVESRMRFDNERISTS